MKTLQHIEETVKIGNISWKLTKKEREEIVKKFENFLGKNFCRMCRYCEGYQKVSLADVLKLLIIAKNYGYLNFVKWQYSSFKERILGENFDDSEKVCPYNLQINKMIIELQKLIF
jgi:predicted aldo/keto reductase-like oxidoreductase